MNRKCKCASPLALCWPSQREWNLFNSSVNGKLLQPLPAAHSCHIPYYNRNACNITAQSYFDGIWRTNHPTALQIPMNELDENNKGCLGVDNPTSYCFRGNLPYYVLNVSHANHVIKAVQFASEHNLRIAIKNTGHDYHAKSTINGGLSLWTHNMKDISFEDNFVAEGCTQCSGQTAVKVGPGVQWFELFPLADAHGVTLVGGSCSTVGAAGGYSLGGGHGMLSTYYGLAADNILQIKVVTADGKLRIANKCQNRDLFWALRGGGGGTFGVVVEITYKTFPSPPVVGAIHHFTASTDEAFQDLVAGYLEFVPELYQQGWAGYVVIAASRTLSWWITHLPSTNTTSSLASLSTFFNFVNSRSDLQYITQQVTAYPTYYPWYETFSTQVVPPISNFLIGTWLMPKENFEDEEKIEAHAEALIEVAQRNEGQSVMVFMVADGAVEQNAGCDTSVHKAWRKAATLNVVLSAVPFGASPAQRRQMELSISSQVQTFRDLAPDSAAYLNEADKLEPNWKEAFFGDNYPQLLAIKELYDPDDLFICYRCVGSEGRSSDLNCKL